MKKILLFATMALAACEYPLADQEQEPATPAKQFTFHVKGDFAVSQEEMSRAAADTPLSRATRLENGNTSGLTDLWVLDYGSDGKLIQQVHQASTDADFGTVALSLTYGQHNIKFIASKGTTPQLTGATVGSTTATLSWAKVLDTFSLSYPVEVTSTTNGNRAPELQRAIGGVTAHMVDAVPANANTVDVVWQNSKTLSLPTLNIATPQSTTTTLSFPSGYIGQTDKEFAVYTLVGDVDITTDVVLTFKDADGGTISTRTIPDIVIRKNRMTVLKGKCFTEASATTSFGLSVNNSWSDPANVTF